MLAVPLAILLAAQLAAQLPAAAAVGNSCSASSVHWGPGTKQVTIDPTMAPWERRQSINIEKLCQSALGVVAGVEVTACDTDLTPRIDVSPRRVIVTRQGRLTGLAHVHLELSCAGRRPPAAL